MFWIVFAILYCGISVGSTPPNDDSFLQNIFDKYGNKGYMSFEGLEHLMENLGLGHLKFEEHHNVSIHRTEDGGFQEVHDSLKLHEHNHSRSRRSYTEKENQCLSPEELLQMYGLSPDHQVAISPTGFLHICPGIIYQLDTRVCSVEKTPIEKSNTSSQEQELLVWLYGVSSILVMSACGLLGILLVPIIEKALFQRVLSLLAALAVGTLSGDALLHLLPHALKASNEDMIVLRAATTFVTLLGFFSIEAIIHGRSNAGKKAESEDTVYTVVASSSMEKEPPIKHEDSSITTVAWLVITGDGLHNLTDGIAVGAAFRQDSITGAATALAILSHELPHELGDFAILLKGGMSIKKAVFYNIVSSVLSLAGVVAGLLIGSYGEAALWVYAITAGSFLYISLATLVPEMHKYAHSVPHTLLQLFGMFIGGGIMFIIAMYEHTLHEILKN